MRLLCCDSCPSTAVDDGQAGAWFVFTDSDGPGNARCPDCLPDPLGPGVDLARL